MLRLGQRWWCYVVFSCVGNFDRNLSELGHAILNIVDCIQYIFLITLLWANSVDRGNFPPGLWRVQRPNANLMIRLRLTLAGLFRVAWAWKSSPLFFFTNRALFVVFPLDIFVDLLKLFMLPVQAWKCLVLEVSGWRCHQLHGLLWDGGLGPVHAPLLPTVVVSLEFRYYFFNSGYLVPSEVDAVVPLPSRPHPRVWASWALELSPKRW